MSKFGDAFASARKAGKKTFTWQGKSYTTETREEAAAKKAGGTKKSPTLPTPASERPTAKPTAKPAAKPRTAVSRDAQGKSAKAASELRNNAAARRGRAAQTLGLVPREGGAGRRGRNARNSRHAN